MPEALNCLTVNKTQLEWYVESKSTDYLDNYPRAVNVLNLSMS